MDDDDVSVDLEALRRQIEAAKATTMTSAVPGAPPVPGLVLLNLHTAHAILAALERAERVTYERRVGMKWLFPVLMAIRDDNLSLYSCREAATKALDEYRAALADALPAKRRLPAEDYSADAELFGDPPEEST